MDRLHVIQTLIKQKKLKNYLEIGVFKGHVFFRVRSRSKVAVDPKFTFDTYRKFGKAVSNPHNIFNRYFEKTSDDFFSEDAASLYREDPIELALIDGMHEYSFALRDIENTLRYLADDGVIVVHDCNPVQPDHACSFDEYQAREHTNIWNGDVWKAILHLRSQRDDLHVFVLDCDHGLGIVQKGRPETELDYSPSEIATFGFQDLHPRREHWLGLKPPEYFYEHFALSPSPRS